MITLPAERAQSIIRRMPIDSGYQDGRGRPAPAAHRPAGPAGARTPPPESTGAEVNYLVKQIEARTPMVLKLVDGELLHGVIEYYDRDLLKVARRGAPSILVRKQSIIYMYKDEA